MNSVDKPRVTLNDFKDAMVGAIDTGELTQVFPPLEHYHTANQYGRRIFVKKDSRIITKVHKSEHFTVALKGHCTVVDEDGVKTEVIAPAVFITKPGTRRAVYAHTDVEWITIHATTQQDLAKIEAELVCASQEEADEEDYRRVLAEHNVTERWARIVSENPRTQIGMPPGEDDIRIGPSTREGMGVFALKDFEPGDRIGTVRERLMRTPIGRYTNHSVNPNCEFVVEGNNVAAYAIRPIMIGQEVTVCYRLARKVNVEASRLLESPS